MKLSLTPQLLSVLRALELKRKLLITESSLGLCEDWCSRLHEYFLSLPESCIEDLGLKRNLFCFREIEMMTVPKEWLETPADDLGEFSFSFPG